MIPAASIDLMVRGGSIALLLLWSGLLVRDHRGVLSARLALAMNFAIIAHILSSIPGPVSHATLIDYVVELGAAAVPAIFWLFARAWFNDRVRLGWGSWLAVAATLLLVVVQVRIYDTSGTISVPVAVVMRSAMFAFAAAGLWEAWRGREGDLVEGRRAIRTMFIVAVGLFVIFTNGVEVLVYLGRMPDVMRSVVETGIFALAMTLCLLMLGMRSADLFGAARPQSVAEASKLDPAIAGLAERLVAHVTHAHSWRDETLTIAGLASQLGEPEHRVRRAINGHLGYRNFAAFLNSYRLAEVRAALADPAQREVPILTIALDAGFGSLGPFNRAFRESEGRTPSEYRAAHAG